MGTSTLKITKIDRVDPLTIIPNPQTRCSSRNHDIYENFLGQKLIKHLYFVTNTTKNLGCSDKMMPIIPESILKFTGLKFTGCTTNLSVISELKVAK
ncbi:hypothetical protein AM228_24065 [Planktothricoides sp. SR001]|nr:hypothetical protein AM228_24065 [Planktothricoides sp. SR001]